VGPSGINASVWIDRRGEETWRSGYAQFAVTFMTPVREIQTMEWLQARLLKMCLMIGYVLIVEWAKTSLKRRRKDTGKDTMEA
jgi:hypothetical protein